MIQSHADASRAFSARPDPSSQLNQIEVRLNLLNEKLSAYSTLHSQQHTRAISMKKMTSNHWRYSESVARTIEASRTTSESPVTWNRAFSPNDATSSHFEDIVSELEQQIEQVEVMAESIQRQIEPLLMQSGREAALSSPIDAVRQILSNEIDLKSTLLSRYSQLKADIEVMRRNFQTFCSKFRGDVRDPFISKVAAANTLNPPTLSVAEQLPVQPKPAQNTSLSPGFGTNLPSATTTLAPVKPTGSGFSGFTFGK